MTEIQEEDIYCGRSRAVFGITLKKHERIIKEKDEEITGLKYVVGQIRDAVYDKLLWSNEEKVLIIKQIIERDLKETESPSEAKRRE